MLCDSHCHLNFSQFEGELDKVIEQINKEPMLIINVGTCYLTSIKAIEVSRKSPFFFASIGLHPSHVNLYFKDSKEILSEKDLLPSEKFDEKFEDLLTEKKVVAVGEAGLDFKYLEIFKNEKEKSEAIERQIEEFKKQIQKAKDFHLPLIIHVRELYEKALEILEELNFDPLESDFRGVFHFFSGSLEQAEKIVKRGFFIGFSGAITYKNKLSEVVKRVPIEKILTETDSPYAIPMPYKEKEEINYPFYVKEIVLKISQVKNLSFEKTKKQIFKNTLKFFNITL